MEQILAALLHRDPEQQEFHQAVAEFLTTIQPVLERNRTLAAAMARSTAHLLDHPHVAEVRQHGMVLAIELMRDKARREPYPWQERRGIRVYRHALEQGVLLRPLGNVIYFMPPYVISEEEIELLATVATSGIELAVRD